MKTCSNCYTEKDESEFPKRKDSHDGLRGECKECYRKKKGKYRRENIEADRERKRRFRENNREHVRNHHKNWRDKNKDHVNKKSRKWYRDNIDKARKIKKDWELRNPEKVKEKQKLWYDNNRGHIREVQRAYQNRRYKNDPEYRLTCIMRASIRRIVSGKKGSKVSTKLGYTADQLKKRLECQFQPGMDWSNYGEVWEIDHCIPIKYFLDKGEYRTYIISALSNLQPLWISENRSKGSKYK